MNAVSLLKTYRYEAVAFLTGSAVMALEIVGARLISPHFGTSTYVWTAMIGVILTALAVGFTVGGKLADRDDNASFLSFVLFSAALLLLLTGWFQRPLLAGIASMHIDLRLGALLAASLLFGLPSLLIGMVSPHLAKIRVTSLSSTGTSIGKLEAAGALGSIAGTFSCGYFLLGQFGSRSIVIGIVILLMLTSLLADPAFLKKLRLLSVVLVISSAALVNINPPHVLADVDSSYARYRVVVASFEDHSAHMLLSDNNGIQSAVRADGSSPLVLTYVQRFQQTALAYGNLSRVLVIGGGTFTFPASLAKTFPDVLVDAVEIDPALDDLARRYFYYQDSPRVTIHHADGRHYLNDNTTPYDLVYMDAFSSLSPPFQLTTRETIEHIANSLTTEGVVVVNLVGRYDAGDSEYLRAVRSTYQTAFRHVSLYPTALTDDGGNPRQNYILVASDNQRRYDAVAKSLDATAIELAAGGRVLTDDFAPIEQLTYQ